MVDSLLALCARAGGNPAQHRRLTVEAEAYSAWSTLAERAEKQGLAPLALSHLQAVGAAMPQDARGAFLALTLRHRRANRIRATVLAEILPALRDEEIDVLVLKGAALANSAYPQPGQRPMRDMDILVREKDALRAQQKLVELGFDAAVPRSIDNRSIHHLPVAQRLDDGLTVSVEVHYRLLPYADAFVTYDDLSGNTTTFTVNGLTARTLGHEDMLWHIYRHSFARPLIEQPIRLIWVADFVTLVEKYVDEIDWDKVKRCYPAVINVLPLFHFLTPWSDKVLETLDIPIEPPPKGIGQTFQGWPKSSLATQREKGLVKFLADTFQPSEWWTRLYYGLDRQSFDWWWTRLLGHPLHIGGWLLQYLRNRP